MTTPQFENPQQQPAGQPPAYSGQPGYASQPPPGYPQPYPQQQHSAPTREVNELKTSVLSLEFFIWVVVVLGIIITALAVRGEDGRGDPFNAGDAAFLIVFVTVGYFLARGLSKIGGRRRSDD